MPPQQIQSGQDVTDLMSGPKSGDDVTSLMSGSTAPAPTITPTPAPTPTQTPQMPDASKMLQSGLGGAFNWATTSLTGIHEPTIEEWQRDPARSAWRAGVAGMTTPLSIAGELAGGIGLGIRGMRGVGKLGTIAEEIKKPPIVAEGDILGQQGLKEPGLPTVASEMAAPAIKPRIRANTDGTFTNMNTGEVITPNKPFEPGAPVSVRFNPKGQTGLTGQAQAAKLPPEPEVGHEITLKTQGQAPIIKRFQDMGYVPGGVNSEGRPIMIYKGEQVPIENLPLHPEEKMGLIREILSADRGMASIDPPFVTSAAFRQAHSQMGTLNWFKAWDKSARSYGSKAAHEQLMSRINAMPEFKRNVVTDFAGGKWVNKEQQSLADKAELRMTGLGGMNAQEEMLASKRIEGIIRKIPLYGRHFEASNRAYSAFLNDLRANMFHEMILDHQAMGIDPFTDITKAKEIANYINDATGRGSMGGTIGLPKQTTILGKTIPLTIRGHQVGVNYSLEGAAKILAEGAYSPRLIAARINMLNPATYINASPYIRQKYMRSMARTIGGWWGLASLAEFSGKGTVNKDPSNTDFGKIRIGNTRLDPGGGFQQWLVLASKLRPSITNFDIGTDVSDKFLGGSAFDLATNLVGGHGGGYTSSTSQRRYEFGKGYKPETAGSTVQNFVANKLRPSAKLLWDMAWSQQGRPVWMGDRAMQLFIPMVAQDMAQIMKDDPSLIPIIGAGLFTGTGGGLQTYKSYQTEPVFLSKEHDIPFVWH